jgi:hypothetical protein
MVHAIQNQNSQMTKSIILRADLSIQHHNIIRITGPRLKHMIQRFAVRVDGCDEGVQIHTTSSLPLNACIFYEKISLHIDSLPKLDFITCSPDCCVGDVV